MRLMYWPPNKTVPACWIRQSHQTLAFCECTNSERFIISRSTSQISCCPESMSLLYAALDDRKYALCHAQLL